MHNWVSGFPWLGAGVRIAGRRFVLDVRGGKGGCWHPATCQLPVGPQTHSGGKERKVEGTFLTPPPPLLRWSEHSVYMYALPRLSPLVMTVL